MFFFFVSDLFLLRFFVVFLLLLRLLSLFCIVYYLFLVFVIFVDLYFLFDVLLFVSFLVGVYNLSSLLLCDILLNGFLFVVWLGVYCCCYDIVMMGFVYWLVFDRGLLFVYAFVLLDVLSVFVRIVVLFLRISCNLFACHILFGLLCSGFLLFICWFSLCIGVVFCLLLVLVWFVDICFIFGHWFVFVWLLLIYSMLF
uniref:ATP synthase 6 n=1 Tax=Perkinsela sp. GillNOR1/I TaxID=1766904 RepID=A0A0U2UX58_9EUGL|nr:ATP synthase 6 [Perkinsela sp. GillNOR1/I]